jgi:hypothetical protein
MNDRAASSAHGAVYDAVIPYDTDAADDVEVEVQDHVDSVLAAIRRRRGGRDASQVGSLCCATLAGLRDGSADVAI